MKRGFENKKRKELMDSIRPTELVDFTKQDMYELYAQFMEGPECPRRLYGADIGNEKGGGDISYREFQSQLLRRPNPPTLQDDKRSKDFYPNDQKDYNSKGQKEGYLEFKSVAEPEPDMNHYSKSIPDIEWRKVCRNLQPMAVSTGSSEDSIFGEYNVSKSSTSSGMATTLTVFSAMEKTQSNEGSMEMATSNDSMENATTETMSIY